MAGELSLQTQEPLVVMGLDEFVNDGHGGPKNGMEILIARPKRRSNSGIERL